VNNVVDDLEGDPADEVVGGVEEDMWEREVEGGVGNDGGEDDAVGGNKNNTVMR
jgi:hypothetical protein